MTVSRARSPDGDAPADAGVANGASSSNKRARLDEPVLSSSSSSASAIHLPETSERNELASRYSSSSPYRHISAAGLFDDALLESVVTESRTYGERHDPASQLPGWGWEHKETDIYKIQQTPDLTSLDPEHLPEETLAKLPHLMKLKQGIYSPEFRQFVRDVTGCGPLSGKKVDGSVGLYSQGSHLLLHDDSISTRVVSYILYLPNSPVDVSTASSSSTSSSLVPCRNGSFLKGWEPSWGGALELYPVQGDDDAVGPPAPIPSAKVDVKWGNLVFFEVQPGKSYHSVEEVVVGDGRQRLGISGWFHKPIEGEEGYEAPVAGATEAASAAASSLAQITAAPTKPFVPYELDATSMPDGLTSRHLKHLSQYLAPAYLTASTLEKLAGQFVEGSEVVMHNFLRLDVADKIRQETSKLDEEQYAAYQNVIPSHELGGGDGWKLEAPPSKHRFLSLDENSPPSESTPTIQAILNDLFASDAYRAWLQQVSSLVVLARRCEARRFRRGLDYTLAAGEDKMDGEPRLDGVLGLTWWANKAEDEEEETAAELGGWEAYIASPDESEDPAVYQSGGGNAKSRGDDEGSNGAEAAEASTSGGSAAKTNANSGNTGNGPKITMGGVELEFDQSQFSPSDFDSDSENGEDDDGPLLSNGVGFNKFMLVLRDPGVMRFVKYLSNAAPGSRWDVSGEWEVGQLEEDDDEEAEEVTQS